jgi:pilus assembly protein Flp/PilA
VPLLAPDGAEEESMFEMLQSFVRRDEGQDLLEYALLVALIAVVAVVAVTAAGDKVVAVFDQIVAAI